MAGDRTARHDAAVRAAAVLSPFVVFAAFPLPIPALPAIAADLRVGVGELALLVSGYALGLGAVLMVSGVLADRLGPAKVWIASMIGFAAFSVVCAIATDTTVLVGGRIGEGLAGAGLMASSLTLVATALSPQRRAGAMAFWGAAIGAGLTVGPLAGGIALEFGQWRPIFVALAVLAAAAAALGVVLLPAPATGRSGRIDVVGTVTLACGVGLLILSISWVGAGNWTAPRVWIGLLAAAVLLAGFAVSQHRSAEPMIDTRALRHGDFLGGLVTGLALALSVLSMMVVIGPYLQVVLGASGLQLALWLLPFTGFAFLVAAQGARIGRRLSLRARLVAGLALSGLGMAALLPIDAGWTWPALMPGMTLIGFGVGLANAALAQAAVAPVPPEHSGMAAGVANTARQLGNALGIVVLGAVLQATAQASSAGSGVPAAAIAAIGGGDLNGALASAGGDGGITQLYGVAQTAGVRAALLVAIAMAVAGIAGTAWLMRPALIAHVSPEE